ncbi:hypothetical protein ABIE27_002371 [Paenibacillus sp. 4624]
MVFIVNYFASFFIFGSGYIKPLLFSTFILALILGIDLYKAMKDKKS